jgi:hypothetical protein
MDPYPFINFKKDANDYNQERGCKLRNCIIDAIAWYTQVLKSPDAPRNESVLLLDLLPTWLAIYISHFMPGSLRIEAAIVLRCASMAGKKTCTRCGIRAFLS